MKMTHFRVKAALTTFVLATLVWSVSHAAPAPPTQSQYCQPDQTLFEKIGTAYKALDVRKTINTMITSSITDAPASMIANRNPQQMMNCAYDVLKKNNKGGRYADTLRDIEEKCPSARSTNENCDDFVQTYNATQTTGGNTLAFNQTLTSGSILGVANGLEGAVRTEPLPTNLAYFWNDSIRNVPFAGRALAADVSYGNAPMIGVILAIWKTTRNLAFGLLAIVMLVTGVMIMIRRKLAPQLVVTLQYALPRIPLAVVLIVFSYPIGAVLASSMRFLSDTSGAIIANIALGPEEGLGQGNWPASIGLIVSLVLIGLLQFTGVAAPVMAVVMVMLLVIAVLYIFVFIRAILIYLKLLFSIVFAPIIFALGAIPGNESMTQNWFKGAIVNVLSYAGMFAYTHVVLLIVVLIMVSPANSFDTSSILGSIFGVILSPIFIIFGLLQALKVPGKVNAFIMGEQKGGRR